MLIFTAIFSLIFINIYKPFGSEYWKELSQTQFFLISVIVVVAGIGILTLSRFVMYRSTLYSRLTYWQYFIWCIVEIAFIALLYAFLTKFPFKLSQDFMDLFSSAFLYTALILVFPYLTSWLYFALQDAEKVIDAMTKEEDFVDLTGNKESLIHFKDDKGVLRFSVAHRNILYFESRDNYVIINYLAKSKLERFLLRNSLKNIEDVLNDSFVRCHRSFIINVENVKVLRKDKDGLFLELDIENTPNLPVSKTYAAKLLQILSKN